MQIFDISRALSRELVSWPGDTAFRFALSWKMAAGASVNVGAIEMSTHNGTHADAPFHFEAEGATIDQMPLAFFVGTARVLDVTGLVRPEIAVTDLEAALADDELPPRLLLRTGAWPEGAPFPEIIPVIAHDVAVWLKARGVKLLGLDLPSVDAIDSKDLPNHHALATAGIAILENLNLETIEAGDYQLAALPLKIEGGDAAPVRAILWRD